ncbi:hypothetical protein IEQ34_005307 [Dendrobium chrysotoxum]|uniref:Uncharacterized protein n=1 Tax=Dendrobium chrysotoxum TaxID=161865 RepID=A0AAV7HAP2_DENCH|nr:hypothetical protein IEQ34_005307 [Dendrobium chrysotoxum]
MSFAGGWLKFSDWTLMMASEPEILTSTSIFPIPPLTVVVVLLGVPMPCSFVLALFASVSSSSTFARSSFMYETASASREALSILDTLGTTERKA